MTELNLTEYFRTNFTSNVNYILINPFGEITNGVNTYTKMSKSILDTYGVKNSIIQNTYGMKIPEFREYCREKIERDFNPINTIVECPETNSACLNLSKNYFLHVRMHTPMAICQLFDDVEMDIKRFSDEIEQIKQSSIATSPSYGLINIMINYMPNFGFSKFINPMIPLSIDSQNQTKNYDIILMFRAQNLKGLQFIPEVVEKLSIKGYKVLLIGSGMTKIPFKNNGNIITHEHINSKDRYNFLINSKCALILSKFENCSMAILESIALGVPVVAWNVGGNTEFSHEAVSTVPLGDIDGLIEMVEIRLKTPPFSPEKIIKLVRDEYINGIANVFEKFKAFIKAK